MTIKILDSIYGNEGKIIPIEVDGKKTARRVYYRRDCGLYIRVRNIAIFELDFRDSDTFIYN